MPELPEVQTTVDGLNKKVLNRTFVDVWSDWKKTIKKPGFDNFKKEIKGKKIIRIWRRAKNIIFDLSENYSLLVHQKMTGHLLYGNWEMVNNRWQPVGEGPLNDPYNRFLHVIFYLDNKKMLALSDARKFAKIELWPTNELIQELDKLGPEPLEKDFTFEKFRTIIKKQRGLPAGRQGKIKQVLMKPETIAGIGNIYSDEALWWARIHPLRKASELKEKELKELYSAIRKVLQAGIRLGGESFSDYRNLEGDKGNFDDERAVYQREGESCRRDGTIIKRIKIGGRSSCFCPKCQI